VAERPVVKRSAINAAPITESELTAALAYARTDRPARKRRKKDTEDPKPYIGQELDRNLLRVIANTALQRWVNETGRRVILPLLAANVVRDVVPQFRDSVQRDNLMYQAYKGATMKIMSIRRVWQMEADKQKKLRGKPIPERVTQTEHPAEQIKGLGVQLRLFS